MRKRKSLLWLLAALLLAGCSLARPEAAEQAGGGDRWVGFFAAPSQDGRSAFYNNPYLEEYGTFSAETDQFGTLELPQDVLFAVEDEVGNYTFPGIEVGFNLFFVETVEEYGPCTKVVSNMGPHENGAALTYKDEGSFTTLSGTVYCGPPLDAADWDPYDDETIWNFFRVYQTADGRVYINGDGDSTNGPMTHTRTETQTYRENDETVQEETVSVTVAVETVDRMERLVVTQFDENNAVVRSDDLALRDGLPEVNCEAETAWALVEEISAEGTVRTVYSVPEEGEDPVSHTVILLDDEGLGRLAYLTIQ